MFKNIAITPKYILYRVKSLFQPSWYLFNVRFPSSVGWYISYTKLFQYLNQVRDQYWLVFNFIN